MRRRTSERVELAAKLGVVGEGGSDLTILVAHGVAATADARETADAFDAEAGRRAILLTARAHHHLTVAAEERANHPLRAEDTPVDAVALQAHDAARLECRREQPIDARRAANVKAHEAVVVDAAHVPALRDAAVANDAQRLRHEGAPLHILHGWRRQALRVDDAMQPILSGGKWLHDAASVGSAPDEDVRRRERRANVGAG